MKWTDAQQSAIDAPKPGKRDSQTLLVAAAAGSGKTAVLVERIIQRLARKEISVRELLVVTFTKAAAAEMCGRVGAKLAEVFAETQDPYLEEQLNLLPSAHISTLHSFCQWVIRSYFYQLDMDPSFRIGNEGELSLLQSDVLDAVLLAAHQSGDPAIEDLSDFISGMRSDQALKTLVLDTYQFVMAQSYPEGWMQQVEAQYEAALTSESIETVWGRGLWKWQQEDIANIVQLHQRLERLCTMPGGAVSLLTYADEAKPFIEALTAASNWDEMHEAVQLLDGVTFSRWNGRSAEKEYGAELVSKCQAVRTALKDALVAMQDSPFMGTREAWVAQLENQRPLIGGVLRLVREFRAAYTAAKKEQGMLDFSDLEHLCLALLVEPGTEANPQPSAVAKELQALFQEVMVDEYQDTNGVQEAIVNLVSRKDNRFYVGDVKQSIYRFRMADPSLFMQKYKTFSQDVEAEERRIDLAQNFRSDGNVLAFTNFIFRQIMTEEGAELTYGDAEALYVGRVVEDPPDNWVGGDVEVMLVETEDESYLAEIMPQEADESTPDTEHRTEDTDSAAKGNQALSALAAALTEEEDAEDITGTEREIAMIIQRIQQMRADNQVVQDKDGSFRPLAWRDIVILHRSVNSISSLLVERLRLAGIPAYAEEKTGYFNALEVQLVISLLQIIDNPEQDLPMAAILRSFIVGLTMEDLARIRLRGTGSLWSLLPKYAAEMEDARLSQFIAHMDRWRTLSRRKGIRELLWDVYETLHIVDYVSAMPNGIVRRANVVALYDRAKQYEEGGFRGLFRFLRFLENLQQAGQDLGIAKTVSEADDVVRIMSIHRSKGLEFPVVFLMATQKKFNDSDTKAKLLLHKEAGMGIKGFYPGPRVIYDSVPWQYVKRCLTLANKAEEERVLYVALTRAKDKLILTGFVKKLPSQCKKLEAVLTSGRCELPTSTIVGANSYLDWILAALSRHLAGNVLRVFSEVEGIEIPDIPQKECRVRLTILPASRFPILTDQPVIATEVLAQVKALAPMDVEPLSAEIAQRMTAVYPYEQAVHTTAKISVSEMKRRFLAREEEASTEEEILTPVSESVESVESVDLQGIFAEKPACMQEEEARRSGAQWGTLMHEAMQWLPTRKYTKESMKQALDNLVLTGYMTQEERDMLNEYALWRFFSSPLGERIIEAERVEKEWPFSQLIPAQRVYPEVEDGEELFLQGIVDLVFWDEDGWVLVDYKTDRIEELSELVRRYEVQLRIYREAIAQLTGQPVKETYIYSLRKHEAVAVG